MPFSLRSFRLPFAATRARVLAAAVASSLVALAACLDDSPTAPRGSPVNLRISAQVGGGEDDWTVGIRVYYWTRTEEQIDLPTDPSSVRVARGQSVEQAVQVDITPCLADPDRADFEGEAGSSGCRLYVELQLLDENGAMLSTETEDAVASAPGETVEVPEFVLPPGEIRAAQTNVSFTAPDASDLPDRVEIELTSSTTEPLGTLSAAVAYSSGTNWLTATIEPGEGGLALIVRPSTTELAPGTYDAVVTVTSARQFVPVDVFVRYVVTNRPKRVTITGAGNGSGGIVINELDANCTINAGQTLGTCTPSVSHGTQVTLDPDPDEGSAFTGWSGACTGTGSCVLTMDQDRAVTATFTLTPKRLTVTMAGSGNGTVSSTPNEAMNCTKIGTQTSGACTILFVHGSQVSLMTFAPSGSTFAGWSGACTGTGACTLTMDENREVMATFNLTVQRLTITGAGSGTGVVFTNDERIGCTITGGQATGDCFEDYPAGTQVAVQREPTGESSFGGWSGACSGTGACVVVMDEAQTVTATFNGPPPPGRDIAVFNDLNVFDDTRMSNPNNVQLVRNLVNFTVTGPRNAGKVVQLECGRQERAWCNDVANPLNVFKQTLQGAGFAVRQTASSGGTLTSIGSDVKLLILFMPCQPFTVTEVNALKLFASEGGRLMYVGENTSAYANCFGVENQLLKDLGAVMTNTGSAVDCGDVLLTAASLRPHQITSGLTGLRIACSSVITLGPNDFALYYNSTNASVLSGVARIDVTPLPVIAGRPLNESARSLKATMPTSQSATAPPPE